MKRMKSIVPFSVRVISLLTATGITVLIVGIHAADLTTLGAPTTAAIQAPTGVAATTQAADPRSHLRAS